MDARRPRPEHLGQLLAHARAASRTARPATSPATTTTATARTSPSWPSSASTPTASRSPGRGCSPTGTGRVNEAGLDFYDRLVDELLAHGITPHLTLYHWDLPQALENAGGWPVRATAEAFADYASVVAGRLGDRVRHIATLNEPFVVADHGYRIGSHAPGRTEPDAALAAAHTLLVAHGLGVEAIRAAAPEAAVGIVLNFHPAHPLPGTSARPGGGDGRARPGQPLVPRPGRRPGLPRGHRPRLGLAATRRCSTATWS